MRKSSVILIAVKDLETRGHSNNSLNFLHFAKTGRSHVTCFFVCMEFLKYINDVECSRNINDVFNLSTCIRV